MVEDLTDDRGPALIRTTTRLSSRSKGKQLSTPLFFFARLAPPLHTLPHFQIVNCALPARDRARFKARADEASSLHPHPSFSPINCSALHAVHTPPRPARDSSERGLLLAQAPSCCLSPCLQVMAPSAHPSRLEGHPPHR